VHYIFRMTTLTVTERGQVTIRKDVLKHLGIKPGGKIAIDLLPDGQAILKAAQPIGIIEDFIGLLAGRTKKIVSLDAIKQATERAWAGQK
jgi:antitoxin PrlF